MAEEIKAAEPKAPDVSFVKPAIQSQTMRWLLVALIAYAVKVFALPAIPGDVQNEVVNAMIMLLDITINVLIPAAMLRAAQGRMRATTAIQGWFK